MRGTFDHVTGEIEKIVNKRSVTDSTSNNKGKLGNSKSSNLCSKCHGTVWVSVPTFLPSNQQLLRGASVTVPAVSYWCRCRYRRRQMAATGPPTRRLRRGLTRTEVSRTPPTIAKWADRTARYMWDTRGGAMKTPIGHKTKWIVIESE